VALSHARVEMSFPPEHGPDDVFADVYADVGHTSVPPRIVAAKLVATVAGSRHHAGARGDAVATQARRTRQIPVR
jgi:hypothetical protein